MKYFLGIVLGTFLGVLWAKAWGWNWWPPMVGLVVLWVVAGALGVCACLRGAMRERDYQRVKLQRDPRRAA